MADVSFISQAALGSAAAVQLSTLFSGAKGGNAFVVKNVSGAIVLGVDNTVTASTGYPLAPGEAVSVDAGSLKKLWAIGGATDRLAVMVLY